MKWMKKQIEKWTEQDERYMKSARLTHETQSKHIDGQRTQRYL